MLSLVRVAIAVGVWLRLNQQLLNTWIRRDIGMFHYCILIFYHTSCTGMRQSTKARLRSSLIIEVDNELF